MTVRVEIDNKQARSVETRKGNKNGRDWSITQQPIWLYQPDSKFPVEINFTLPEDVDSYPAGEYELNVDLALEQGNFKSLMLDTRKLKLSPVVKDHVKK